MDWDVWGHALALEWQALRVDERGGCVESKWVGVSLFLLAFYNPEG